MTLEELRNELARRQSISDCDRLLRANLHEIRPLFYGLTRAQLQDGSRYLEYEDLFYSFQNSAAGRAIQAGDEPPASVVSLLIFFLSLFQRTRLHHSILSVTNFIPAGPLRRQGQAIFEYKNISNAEVDYLDRFGRILTLLQEAWDNSTGPGRRLSEDLLQEYALDSFLEPLAAGFDIRQAATTLFLDPSAQREHPILLAPSVQSLFSTNPINLERMRNTVRARIVEALHEQACELVPDCLLARVSEEFVGDAARTVQTHTRFPSFISEQLSLMSATHNPQHQGARFNYDADDAKNRIYLGTYFPRTVIESWNIFTELLSIPVIQAAFRQKDVIRIMDVGSGTGAAVVGTLLALMAWEEHNFSVEVTSLDTNEDALAKQGEILESLRSHLTFDLEFELRNVRLPFDLEGFVPAFSEIAEQEGRIYDIITIWKCLCEFYNVNFAAAQGIIRNTLSTTSRMLLPNGLCVVSDVTTTDNRYEFFAFTLNREVNEHDREPDAETRTVLPLPCGRNSVACSQKQCYSQRCFRFNHRLAQNDITKIAYRVLATPSFAQSIVTSFTDNDAYRVNAARPYEACCNGGIAAVEGDLPCGYTGFFS